MTRAYLKYNPFMTLRKIKTKVPLVKNFQFNDTFLLHFSMPDN